MNSAALLLNSVGLIGLAVFALAGSKVFTGSKSLACLVAAGLCLAAAAVLLSV